MFLIDIISTLWNLQCSISSVNNPGMPGSCWVPCKHYQAQDSKHLFLVIFQFSVNLPHGSQHVSNWHNYHTVEFAIYSNSSVNNSGMPGSCWVPCKHYQVQNSKHLLIFWRWYFSFSVNLYPLEVSMFLIDIISTLWNLQYSIQVWTILGCQGVAESHANIIKFKIVNIYFWWYFSLV